MAETQPPAPEGDAALTAPKEPVTFEQAVHEVNHEDSLKEVKGRSVDRQAELLARVSPERRAEIIAQQQAEAARRRLEATDASETDLREAA